jgi:dephospho-CoA kinase
VAFPELFFTVSNVSAINELESEVKSRVEAPKLTVQEVVKPKVETIIKPDVQPIQTSTTIKEAVVKTKIIGLTGGIGSGKTTIAHYIQSKGIPVYISDVEAKKVMELPEILTKITTAFGEEITSNQQLNREKLAGIVFNNPEQLKKLNAIVHPAVKKHFEQWVKQHQNHSIVVKEAAILFESGSYKDCDAVISVITPIDLRIERVVKRDNTTLEKVQQRIINQISDEERISKSDYIIRNLSLEEAKKQTDQILNLLENS